MLDLVESCANPSNSVPGDSRGWLRDSRRINSTFVHITSLGSDHLVMTPESSGSQYVGLSDACCDASQDSRHRKCDGPSKWHWVPDDRSYQYEEVSCRNPETVVRTFAPSVKGNTLTKRKGPTATNSDSVEVVTLLDCMRMVMPHPDNTIRERSASKLPLDP